MGSQCFSVIPARGGSKRFPGKNLALLAGKPLIAYTIEAALESDVFDDVYVSSEDDAILKVAEQYGATALRRPQELAGDDVMMPALCTHIVSSLRDNGHDYSCFALLQPTSPLRNAADIRAASEVLKGKDIDAVVTVSPFLQPVQRAIRIKDGYVSPFFSVGEMEKGEQAFEQLYSCHGAICMSDVDVFLKRHSFLHERTAPYILPSERSVDINSLLELQWAQFLLTSSLKH